MISLTAMTLAEGAGADTLPGAAYGRRSMEMIMKMPAISCVLFVAMFVAVAQSTDEHVATLESLTQDLADSDERVRVKACDSLGRLGEKANPAALAIGVLAVNDKSPFVRQMAAQSLGYIALHTRETPSANDDALVDLLTKALRDPEANVRLMAAQSIGHFQKNADSATMTLAMVATSDGNAKVRKAAVSSLGTIGRFNGPESKKAVPYLTKALSDDDPEIRRLSAYVLSLFGEASLPALPKLMDSLRDGPAKAQKEAARTLGGYGPAAISAVPLLLDKVKQERDLQLRGVAAKAVVRIDPSQLKTVVGILEEGSLAKDSGIRIFALQALLEVDDKRAYILPTLKRMQSDEIIDIQLMVAEAMENVRELARAAANEQVLPARDGKAVGAPKVTFQDATRDDADAALAMLRTFLDLWQNKEYTKAEALVDERVRLGWRKQMEQRTMSLRSIDDINVFKSKDMLRARAHISTAPKGGLGLDLMFIDGKWWMTGG
jgi:HEAT repeat protein